MIWFLAYLGVGVFLWGVFFMWDLGKTIRNTPGSSVSWDDIREHFDTHSEFFDYPSGNGEFLSQSAVCILLWPLLLGYMAWRVLKRTFSLVLEALLRMMVYLAGKRVTK